MKLYYLLWVDMTLINILSIFRFICPWKGRLKVNISPISLIVRIFLMLQTIELSIRENFYVIACSHVQKTHIHRSYCLFHHFPLRFQLREEVFTTKNFK